MTNMIEDLPQESRMGVPLDVLDVVNRGNEGQNAKGMNENPESGGPRRDTGVAKCAVTS